MRRRAAALGERIRAEQGVRRAVDIIHAYADARIASPFRYASMAERKEW
jgi:hypothetical protein